MSTDEMINNISSSRIKMISKLKDIKTLSKLMKHHNNDVVSNTVSDKIESIIDEIESEFKDNLNFITSYHYMNTLVEKLTETTKRAKEIESVKFSDIDKVPEDFDVEKYDELTGKYMDQNKNE